MLTNKPVNTEKFYHNSGNTPLLSLLTRQSGRALDCGCGAGDNARLLQEKGWAVTGITLSRLEQEAAEFYCERVVLANLEEGLPPSIVLTGKYDLIVLSHILEHLANPGILLEDLKQVLAPDGILLVALPNVLNYRQRLKFLAGKFEYQNSGIMDETHLHFYTFKSGRQLLEAHKYQLDLALADGAFPLWKLRAFVPSSWVGRLNRWSCRRWPGLFGYQSLYVARLS